MIKQSSIEHFLDELASRKPTPGGGSAAAVIGAMAAALLSMVCNLTIGKAKYRDVERELNAVLARTEELRLQLTSPQLAATTEIPHRRGRKFVVGTHLRPPRGPY